MIFKFISICGTLFIINLSVSFAEDTKKEYDIFYDRMELITVNGANDVLNVDLNVEKKGPIQFNINGFVEHNLEFNNSWALQLTIFKADQKDGEYRKRVQYPPNRYKGICEFLKDEYRKYFYESLKDCSNAPHYDTCPLPPAKYTLTNYIFDASAFKRFLNPGYFYVIMSISSPLVETVELKIEFHVEEISR